MKYVEPSLRANEPLAARPKAVAGRNPDFSFESLDRHVASLLAMTT